MMRDVLVPNLYADLWFWVAAINVAVKSVHLPFANTNALTVFVNDRVRVVDIFGSQTNWFYRSYRNKT